MAKNEGIELRNPFREVTPPVTPKKKVKKKKKAHNKKKKQKQMAPLAKYD